MIFAKKNIVRLICVGLFSSTLIQAQNELIIGNQNLTSGDYKARDKVQALPNTSAVTTGTDQIKLFIDKSITNPASYSSTGSGVITDINRSLDLSKPVGTTNSSYSITPFGSASYSVPIAVPPGTMNIVPNLSIEYNSQSTQGLVGYGWNLSGLTSITRIGKTFYHNGQVDAINLDNNDWFALDGNRLMPISGSNGQNNTEYKTEAETFNKITSYGDIGSGPAYFKVETKDGLTFEIGSTNDSRLIPIGQNTVLVWMVRSIYDAYGNYMTFEYQNTNGEINIKEIKYTGNQDAGIQPYNSIKFFYDQKQEKTNAFYNGGETNSTLVLRNIEIRTEGTFYKEYSFKYNFNNVYTFLEEIEEQGADYSKLNSLAFCYLNDENTSQYQQTDNLLEIGHEYDYSNRKYLPLDLNQDGKKDMVVFDGNSTGGLGGAEIYWQDWKDKLNIGNNQFSMGNTNTFPGSFVPDDFYPVDKSAAGNMTFDISDLDGNGTEDILLTTYSGSGATSQVKVYPYLSTGTGFGTHLAALAGNYDNTSLTSAVRYLDFNGDQKLDVFMSYNGAHKVWLDVTGSPTTIAGPVFNFNNAFAADINGDGKAELVGIILNTGAGGYPAGKYILKYENNVFVFVQDLSGFSYVPPSNGSCQATGFVFSLSGDFNGDAKSDFINCINSGGPVWNINYGKGNGTYKTSLFTTLSSHNPFVADCSIFYYTRDVNADGKTDILEFITNIGNGTTTLNVYYSLGNTFTDPDTFTINEEIGKSTHQIDFGDFNGDGTEDLFIVSYQYASIPKIFYFFKGAKSKYLKQAVNGFNTKIEFEYTHLCADDGLYTRSVIKNYPLNNFNGPMYVVSKVTLPDGVGGFNITDYYYENAIIHKQGKGFLGFSKITSINNTNGYKKVDQFSFDPNFFAASPLSSTTYLNSTNAILSDNIYVNQVSALGSNRYYSRITQSIQGNNIAGFSTTSDFQYDANGNLTSQTVTVGTNKQITEIVNTFTQSGAWLPSKVASTVTTITRQGETPNIRQANYNYNAKGQVTQSTLDPGKSKSVIKNYTYNSNTGVLITEDKSASGLPLQSMTYEYDLNSRFAVKSTNILNQITETTFDPKWGKAILTKNVSGLFTQNIYDGFGRLIKTVTPDGIASTNVYSWVTSGEIVPGDDPIDVTNSVYSISQQTSGAPTVKTFYDSYGKERKTETDGYNGKIYTVKSYTSRGTIYKESGAYEVSPTSAYIPVVTTYTYDDLARLTKTQSVAASVTNTTNYSYSYSAENTTVTTTMPDNNIYTKTTDPTDILISGSDNGGNLTYQYYSDGQLKATILNSTVTNSVEYDEYGRQKKLDEKNSGITLYNYDAFGQLISQTDANNKTYQFQFDALNRMTQKSGPDGVYTYQYVNAGSGLNNIKTLTGPNGISYNYAYDVLSRLTQIDENISGQHFVTSYQYDEFNNVKKQTYPSGFIIENEYDEHGYHKLVKRADNSQVLWELNEMNPLGQYTKYTNATGIQTQNTFTNFGLPVRIKAGSVQDLNFDFDPASSNLNSRHDAIKNKTENFVYDNLERLISSEVTSLDPINLSYTSNGNINNKSNIGSYSYHGLKENAVETVDNSNNLISSIEQNISYTSFNKAELLTEGDNSLSITYGPDDSRKKTELSNQGNLISTRFFSSDYEKTITGSTTQEVHFINCSGGLVAIYVIQNGVGSMYFPYLDHLGSILTVTNDLGAVVAEQNFDPWGNRRNPSDWSYTNVPVNPTWLYRGFTGHEYLPEFDLINMNGRMYDPQNGRMLSVDNYVQDNSFTQTYNRYSYAANNPLKFTDPDGNFFLFALFFTEIGYDVQKYILPTAFKVDVAWGTHQKALGIQTSIGGPQIAGGSARVNGSADYYWKNYEVSPGWQTTYGYEIAVTPFVVVGSTHYNSPGTEFDQTLGSLRLGLPGFNVKYENDWWPLIHTGDNGDRYRTAALKVQAGPISVGFNLFTGDPGWHDRNVNPNLGGKYGQYEKTANGDDPDKYRAGVGYIGFGMFRIGNDKESRRDKIQNKAIHDRVGSPHFKVLDRADKFYFQFGTVGSLW